MEAMMILIRHDDVRSRGAKVTSLPVCGDVKRYERIRTLIHLFCF